MVCVGGRVTYFNGKCKGFGLEIRTLFSCCVTLDTLFRILGVRMRRLKKRISESRPTPLPFY